MTEGQKVEFSTPLQFPPPFALPGQAVYWSAGIPSKRDSVLMNERDQNVVSLPSPAPVTGQKSIGMQAYFRGRWQSDTRAIVSQNAADITYLQFAPTRVAGVSIRADKREFKAQALYNGAVTIILDLSGSMEGKKQKDAINALDEIMKDLNNITVSVWIFGDAPSEKKVENDPNIKIQVGEDTITRIQEPV